MKLLFDHNISPDLVRRFGDLFPGSDHVYRLGLHEIDDAAVWTYARDNDFIIVSKDADFAELSTVHGFPPKLLWLRIGNCRTEDIEALIRSNYAAVEQLAPDEEPGILSLYSKSA